MKHALAIAAASIALLGLGACEQKTDNPAEGPAEQAGAKIDEAAEKLRPALNKAGEKIGQALQKGGEKLEEASRETPREAEKKE